MSKEFVLNESEKLMKSIMDAVDAFYRKKGTDKDGKVILNMPQLLNALGSFSGRIIGHSPHSTREQFLLKYLSDFATHAGFKADIKLTRVQ